MVKTERNGSEDSKGACRRLCGLGICGGYQMLGQSLSDPEGVEDGGSMKGLGLLPVTTTFTTEKTRTRVNGTLLHGGESEST